MTITWNHYLWDEDHHVDPASIRYLEDELDIIFPQDYLDAVVSNDGKTPSPSVLSINGRTTGIDVLFLIEGGEPEESSTIRSNLEYIEDDVPEKIIPIMGTGGASVIAFDYRLSNRNPKVVFVNADKEGEDAITEISANFTDFLSLLKSAQHSYI
ncbi:MAG: hypothetical protein CMK83_13705 [Pseudomonadales bacterium]|nr:hypothetical protein [Pseudomonadales bacterium]MAQ25258.1 hypothetical protein [Pseudomonadales bacterium]MBI27884.1 hypothetical protein [Pseudomonadales bacterium]HAU15491.1 hypothetical protein [Gammaproteobacteria bacterium]|tara:strand:+ start:656 stop:1120 length:465 start_codon:yes stop_codon:yes gene_type:complete